MSKHTPGPWEIDKRCETSVFAELDGRRGICSTGGYSTNTIDPEVLNDENNANARLIAAAPDLLEALGTILMMIPAVTYGTVEDANLLSNIEDVARQAIARAEAKS